MGGGGTSAGDIQAAINAPLASALNKAESVFNKYINESKATLTDFNDQAKQLLQDSLSQAEQQGKPFTEAGLTALDQSMDLLGLARPVEGSAERARRESEYIDAKKAYETKVAEIEAGDFKPIEDLLLKRRQIDGKWVYTLYDIKRLLRNAGVVTRRDSRLDKLIQTAGSKQEALGLLQGAIGDTYDSIISEATQRGLLAPESPVAPEAPVFEQTDPQANQEAALEALRNSPGYQFQVEEANRGLLRQRAATGGLLSGNTLDAITRLNQNLADAHLTNRLSQLQAVANPAAQLTAQQAAAQTSAGQVAAGLESQAGQDIARATQLQGQASAQFAVQRGYLGALQARADLANTFRLPIQQTEVGGFLSGLKF